MATQHPSSVLHTPALSAAYPMAKPGYGKRSAPDQQARTRHDFALLSTRERYVAGFVDHLPEGAAMSVKTLAKQLPLYGQQAISTALTALSVAGHLRRVRCAVIGAGDETRWVFRTFWSRTAHDNEWWNTYLATEKAAQAAAPAPGVAATSTPPPPWVPAEDPPPPALPEGARGEAAPESPEPPRTDTAPGAVVPAEAPAPISVPHQRTPADPPDTAPGPGPARDAAPAASPTAPTVPTNRKGPTGPTGPTGLKAPHSPAYLALARLGRTDQRLGLSADDCAALEAQAAEWFAQGVDADYLTAALTAGLPAKVDSPLGFVRRRLADKIPPRLPAEQAPPGAPVRRVLVECTDCGAPGRPEALPDGLCRPCRAAHHPRSAESTASTAEVPADARDIGAYIAGLRDLLKAP
ncbi:MarR family transcriptional regulator [Streptomyces anulatus]|uniref:MarR family transcriptional regulator n=1 Tax=Streptomyces anulatus TaxID=1892 RepID=UPI0033D250E5